jgi:hypothetical protein
MTPSDELQSHDRKLCWIYGTQSREFFPDQPWADIETTLRSGWDRVRSDSRLEWAQALPYVKAAWEA